MTSSIFVFKQRNMLFKKHKDASADNYRPKTANPEKMIVNILRSDFNRDQVRVVCPSAGQSVTLYFFWVFVVFGLTASAQMI